MQIKTPLLFLILLGVLVVGCDRQGGKFVATSSHSRGLQFPVGSIDIVQGYERKPTTDEGNQNEQNLLYVFILTSATNASASSSHDDFGKYVTTLSHSWITEHEGIAVSVSWNRETDIVTIGKSEFIREQGNVFVVRVDTGGETSSKQLKSLGAHISHQQVLEYVQHQLPSDRLISSAKLYQ
jgi:hypothetical protein